MRSSLRMMVGGLAVAVALAIGTPGKARADDVVVFAAASLKDAIEAVGAAFSAETGRSAVASFAASSALAKQIEQGAPADVFISADLDWMDYLAERGLVRVDTRSNLLGNSLVVVGPAGTDVSLEMVPGVDLAAALGEGRLAVGDVKSVPAGRYAKAALETLGVWDSVAGKLAESENVRAALLLVSRGEAPLGVVYRTDALADPSVAVVGTIPPDAHPPIVYPVAVTTESANPDAVAYVDFLKGPTARAIFEAAGFKVLPPVGTN